MAETESERATTEAGVAESVHDASVHDASIWPAVLAGGVTIASLGLLSASWLIGAVGVVATILGIAGWVADLLRDEPHLAGER